MAESTKIYQRACDYANRKSQPTETNFDILWRAAAFIEKCGLEHFGFEDCSFDDSDKTMEYLNQGDAYTETIVCEDGECFVSCWGDWLEAAEKQYCQDENKIKCGNCGAFAKNSADDWSDNECNDCDHYVDGRPIPEIGSQLSDCVEICDGDYERIWLQKARIETHVDKRRHTTIAIRVQYTEQYDHEWAEQSGRYHVEVLAVNPAIVGKKTLLSMLNSYGLSLADWAKHSHQAKCEICIQEGISATLWQDTGNELNALLVSAEHERQTSNVFIGFQLARSQNGIGTTGWDCMKGNILGGLKK